MTPTKSPGTTSTTSPPAAAVPLPLDSCVPEVNLYHIGNPAGAALPRRPGSSRQNDIVSIRPDVTHKANTCMLDVNYKAKSKMDNVNYDMNFPSLPDKTNQRDSDNSPLREVTFKATKYNTSYNETLMQE